MQDRSPPTRQIFLLRTAGPYIGSKAESMHVRAMSALLPKADIAEDAQHGTVVRRRKADEPFAEIFLRKSRRTAIGDPENGARVAGAVERHIAVEQGGRPVGGVKRGDDPMDVAGISGCAKRCYQRD